MYNSSLIKIKRQLKNYFSYFKDKNILVVSEDKSVMPFAFLITENNKLLLSLAIDYPSPKKAVELALIANKVKNLNITHNFFISQTGATHIGENAEKYYYLENELPLNELEPENTEIH